jgi:hypothetical protein
MGVEAKVVDVVAAYRTSFNPGLYQASGLKASSNEPQLPRQLRRVIVDRFEKSLRH